MMEWLLLYSFIVICTTQNVRSYPTGVCSEYQRTSQGRNMTVLHCCHHFYKINEVCVECPIGHTSKAKACKKCENGQYGQKCAETCRCNSTTRCDHVKGCIPGYAATGTTPHKTATISNSSGQTAGNGNTNVVIFMACVAAGSVVIVICAILVKNRRAVRRRKKTTTAMEHAKRNKKGQTLKCENKNVKDNRESMYADINEKYMINFDGEE